MTLLSLDAFRASARALTCDQAAAECNDAFFDECGAARIFLYRDGFFVAEMPDGSFWVPVEHDECSGTREECEEFLYREAYAGRFAEIPS